MATTLRALAADARHLAPITHPACRMIHIERPSAPSRFELEVATGLSQAAAFFSMPRERRQGRAFDFKKSQARLVELCREPLAALFGRKCAFCESPSTSVAGEVALYRPPNGVAEASGGYLGDHYWRQAFSWANFYYVCAVCNRNKANRFPVDGPRAAADADDDEVRLERPLLLDPCGDEPGDQLLFSRDGRVSGSTERGRITIEILNLNRPQLVEMRRAEAAGFLAASEDIDRLSLLEPSRPFLGLKRQLYASIQEPRRAQEELQRAISAQEAFDSSRDSVDTTTKSGLENYRSRARYVEHISIENIASIESLGLDLAAPASDRTPCFALLGNNGVGKSTVLKCLAIALSGRQYARRLRLTSNSVLRDDCVSGAIAVRLTGYSTPIVVRARRNRPLEFDTTEARALVVGYGATRLLATRRHKPKPGMAHAKIDNLFDPFLPLSDASRWLAALPPHRFADASDTLRALLPEEDDPRLTSPGPSETELALSVASDSPRRLSQLSDGYQSLLGLAVDLMDVMHEQGYESMKSAQGIALVDELGNHFHPRWRMRIVESLRRAFPQVQFVFSTHDPLCLHGLGNGEVAVLQRLRNRRVFAVEDLPNVEGLRVDQLLTSEHFGLDTTVDPQTEEDMRRYRALSEKAERTADEGAELEGLVAKLTQLRLLGATRRERQLLRLLDLDEAQHPPPDVPSVKASEMAEATVHRLQDLLRVLEQGNPAAGP